MEFYLQWNSLNGITVNRFIWLMGSVCPKVIPLSCAHCIYLPDQEQRHVGRGRPWWSWMANLLHVGRAVPAANWNRTKKIESLLKKNILYF